jgi:hypothetical protein
VTNAREIELRAWVTSVIAQEARHLADTADYDQVAKTDEEDDFIRRELHRQGDRIESYTVARVIQGVGTDDNPTRLVRKRSGSLRRK